MEQDGQYELVRSIKVQSSSMNNEPEQQHYASLQETKTGDGVYQDLQVLNKSPTETVVSSIKGKNKSNRYKYFWVIGTVATALAILAIVGVIIVAGVFVSALQENTATLTRQIVELENKLNQTQWQVNDLQSIQNGIQLSLANTNTQVNSLQRSTTSQLSSLQSSVNTLTTRVNSPVNLYQNCIEETMSCDVTVPDTSTDIYVDSCDTPPLPINKAVAI